MKIVSNSIHNHIYIQECMPVSLLGKKDLIGFSFDKFQSAAANGRAG